jgi:trans-2,3-dihydro-3-hydroxyanthranilate isomerase
LCATVRPYADAMRRLSYEVVDVFTDRPFAGNPLAVVFGAEDLATEQLQAITREFNLSETIFIMPPTDAAATYKARIFTPAAELPFAGHPSVGGAVTQLFRGLIKPGEVVMECGAGLLPIVVEEPARALLTGGTPTVGPELDPAPLLEAVGLGLADFAGPAPRMAGCGLEFPFLHVRPGAVAKAHVPDAASVPQISVFSFDGETRRAHVRVLCPGQGVPEDPATGSAALGLGVWLVAAGLVAGDGRCTYQISQGLEIQRPSTLDCSVTAEGGRAVSATVSGHVVAIASGEIAIPPFVG